MDFLKTCCARAFSWECGRLARQGSGQNVLRQPLEARAILHHPMLATRCTLWPVATSAVLGPDDFIEPLDDLQDFLRCGMSKALPNAFDR